MPQTVVTFWAATRTHNCALLLFGLLLEHTTLRYTAEHSPNELTDQCHLHMLHVYNFIERKNSRIVDVFFIAAFIKPRVYETRYTHSY